MQDETEEDLRQINEALTGRENEGDRAFFDDLLASAFVLRRKTGAVESREMFLLSLAPGGTRTCDARSIEIARRGAARAIVDCVVEMDGVAYLNTRLFAKDGQGRWKLLAWANETR